MDYQKVGVIGCYDGWFGDYEFISTLIDESFLAHYGLCLKRNRLSRWVLGVMRWYESEKGREESGWGNYRGGKRGIVKHNGSSVSVAGEVI